MSAVGETNKLFSEIKTIILTGDSNKGKTSTLNTLLSLALGKEINFITRNNNNTTKGFTEINFHSSKEFIIKNEIFFKIFDNIDELIKFYNEETCKFSTLSQYIIKIFLPKPEMIDDEIKIIDCVGKTYENIKYYEDQLEKIISNNPNYLKVFVTTELSVDICSNNRFILLTHADRIDERQINDHKNMRKSFEEQNINYISNVDTDKDYINLDNNKIQVFTKKNIDKLWKIMHNKIQENNFKVMKFEDMIMEVRKNYLATREQLLSIICKCNNKNFYDEFNKLYNEKNILNGNELNEKKNQLEDYVNIQKEEFITFKKGNYCKKAEDNLKKDIKNIFGTEYEDDKYDSVFKLYKSHNKNKISNIIDILYYKYGSKPLETELNKRKRD